MKETVQKDQHLAIAHFCSGLVEAKLQRYSRMILSILSIFEWFWKEITWLYNLKCSLIKKKNNINIYMYNPIWFEFHSSTIQPCIDVFLLQIQRGYIWFWQSCGEITVSNLHWLHPAWDGIQADAIRGNHDLVLSEQVKDIVSI